MGNVSRMTSSGNKILSPKPLERHAIYYQNGKIIMVVSKTTTRLNLMLVLSLQM